MEDNKNFIGSNAKYICMSGVERRMRTKERTRGRAVQWSVSACNLFERTESSYSLSGI